MLERAELHLTFCSLLSDASDYLSRLLLDVPIKKLNMLCLGVLVKFKYHLDLGSL